MNLPEILQPLLDLFTSSATIKSIYGEPVQIDNKTIIPVAKVAFGFGGGTGKKEKATSPQEGAGAGGGVAAKPVGVYEITQSGTKFIPAHANRKVILAGLTGASLGILFARRYYKRQRDLYNSNFSL